MRKATIGTIILAAGWAVALTGCSKKDEAEACTPAPGIDAGAGPYSPSIDAANFSATIDNPYLPWAPGTVYRFEGTSDGEAQVNVVTVLSEPHVILGVTCVAVDDRVEVAGELEEQTTDWYAQDLDGNVWYFGEDSKEYANGQVVSTEGSWVAGIDGALPGIVMEANPQVGDAYRQEFLAGEAEDMAEVTELGQSVDVPFGSFTDVVVIREWSPLEPCVSETKAYAPGVGVVQEHMVTGGQEDMELVSVTTTGGGAAGAGGAGGTP